MKKLRSKSNHYQVLLIFIQVLVYLPRGIAETKRPNIVFILADDLGFHDVSFRGNREFLTPNIDALAYHGKILDRLYAASICTPSRGTLLTGRYPIHTGLQHYVISNEQPWGLPTNITTMAEIFRDAGYSTNLVGKWHLGSAKVEFTPTRRGFDYHYGYWGGYIDYFYRRARMPIGIYKGKGYDFRRNLDLECGELGTYVTDLITNEAERVISRNNGTRPLFLLVNHLAPHTGAEDEPLQAVADELEKFKHISDPERRKYAAMISRLDQSVGRIVAALERSDMLKNSIIIFYSDNGAPTAGFFANGGNNWPLRGQKNSPWEGGVRVAGAIWSPLLKARSTIWRQPIYVGDWLPTLATAAGIRLDPALNLDGIDLWAQLSGGANSAPNIEREIVHNLDTTWNVESYMFGKWKYINGTTDNGTYDIVFPLRAKREIDPRDFFYAHVIKSSQVAKSLQHYAERPLNKFQIKQLRYSTVVNCGLLRSSCSPLVEECLFNIEADPCEQNNLARIAQYQSVIQEMRERLDVYRASSLPEANVPGRDEYGPAFHKCTWVNFLDEPPSKEPLTCGYRGLPCEKVGYATY